jgi:hypothetical protein
MNWNMRTVVWSFTLMAIAAAVYWAPPPNTDVVAPKQTVQENVSGNPVQTAITSAFADGQGRLLSIRTRNMPENLSAAFSEFDGAVGLEKKRPSVPIAPPTVEAPVQAPPLPFKFIGRYVEDGQAKIFVQNQDQDFVLKVGDTIQQIYKVAAVSASTVTFVYLPLGQEQSLDLGSGP